MKLNLFPEISRKFKITTIVVPNPAAAQFETSITNTFSRLKNPGWKGGVAFNFETKWNETQSIIRPQTLQNVNKIVSWTPKFIHFELGAFFKSGLRSLILRSICFKLMKIFSGVGNFNSQVFQSEPNCVQNLQISWEGVKFCVGIVTQSFFYSTAE